MGFFTSIRNLFRGDAQPESAAQETNAGGTLPPSSQTNGPASPTPEQEALTVALRQAEPRLSAWLTVVLEGVEKADDRLWARIAFLLRSLEVPAVEVNAFIAKFRLWLDDMEYERLEDFKSELQYRLALALDLEDEEDERSRLMLKLSEGLAKTREQISRGLNTLFASGRTIDESFWEELEEILIMADVGFATAHALTERLRRRARTEGIREAAELRAAMRLELLDVFKPMRRISVVNPPEVVLMIGVNGVGKTTTIAKLCHRAVLQGKKVLLVAGDTFRAAATEQLEIWAKRAGAGFYAKGHGADPAAVAFEAIDQAVTEGCDMVFVDTAGRLHTKVNLMEELQKVARVLGKRHPGAPHRTILVLDATTGQNALSQVKLFNEACGIDELVLTKLDGTAKGGIAVAIAMQYGIPISFVGLGEKMDDLRPFDPEGYVSALLGLEKG
jgi:fused signal recognition particle receptor